MQSNPETVKQAKKYARRYKLWHAVLSAVIFLGYFFTAFSGNGVAILAAFVVGLLLLLFGPPFLFRKCIVSILNKRLDADTYLETIRQGRFDTPAAVWQVLGEYFSGNYQNVINICQKKMADCKTARKYTYHYLTYLANVYFDIGDDENLRRICEQYEVALATEKPIKQARCHKRYPRMKFYDLYLKQDMANCLAWVNQPTPAPIIQHHRTFCKARLALLQGNVEEARGYYEALAKAVPQLNYSKLATEALAGMDTSDDPSSLCKLTNREVHSDESGDVPLFPTPFYKLRRVLGLCILAVALLMLLFYFAVTFLWSFYSDLNYEREMEAYRENIRILVEQDCDGVEVLETFTLKNGEEVIDTMFLCRTDDEVFVGCTYVYKGQTEQHYEKMTDIPTRTLSTKWSTRLYCSFPSKTSQNQINGYFCTEQEDLPTEYYHLSTFEVNEQTVYFVITEITPLSVIATPD